MAFQTSSGEDYNFQKFGYSSGGSVSSKVNGLDRTQDELLNHAASYPYPNETKSRAAVKDRLTKLRKQYHDPAWHRHLSETEFKGKSNEEIQDLPPGD